MKTQWTPGPWAVEPVTHLIEKFRKEGKPTFYTASIIPTPDAAFRGYVCHMQDAEHINGIAGPECEANARLIAAAPEMFALLEEMVNTVEWEEGTERVMSTNNAKLYKLMGGTARALLAKVKA